MVPISGGTEWLTRQQWEGVFTIFPLDLLKLEDCVNDSPVCIFLLRKRNVSEFSIILTVTTGQ